MSPQEPLPGGTVQKRDLHFFVLADCSGSMQGNKIGALNYAMSEAVEAVKTAARTNPNVKVMMRAIKFADRAQWHVGPTAVPLETFNWVNLQAGGLTATAGAIRMLAGELATERMPQRGVPPVCILISDGYCSDPDSEYDNALADLLALPWGKKAVRLAVGIGDKSEYDTNALLRFVSHKEIGVLPADTPQKLVNYIRWASSAAVMSASSPKSQVTTTASEHAVAMAAPPATLINQPVANISAANEVF